MGYEWTVLQNGSLPLRANGMSVPFMEHQCTSALVWPEGERPSYENSIATDPCFTADGLRRAKRVFDGMGVSFADVVWAFVSHRHWDHQPGSRTEAAHLTFRVLSSPAARSGRKVVPIPGHSPDSQALVFESKSDGEVWVVGDAVLDVEWLKAWRYYWPNAYLPEEIVETWRTVAKIVSHADVIVPGHGRPIRVTAGLVKALVDGFAEAEHAAECPDVVEALRKRLRGLARP